MEREFQARVVPVLGRGDGKLPGMRSLPSIGQLGSGIRTFCPSAQQTGYRGMVTQGPNGRVQGALGAGSWLPPPALPSAKRRVIVRGLSLVRHAVGSCSCWLCDFR